MACAAAKMYVGGRSSEGSTGAVMSLSLSGLPTSLSVSSSANSQITCQATWGRPWRTGNTTYSSLMARATSPYMAQIWCCRCFHHHHCPRCCHYLMTHLLTRTYVAFAKQTRSSIYVFLCTSIKSDNIYKQKHLSLL